LAKELGLKSPELLDRIQKWGLDVKVSALASLDPATVDRIRQLMNGAGAPAPAPQTPTAPASGKPAASPPPMPRRKRQ